MKLVMSNLDISAMTAEIKSLSECRINNIFDVDSKFISLKIKTQDKKNKFMMLDSGKKIYLTEAKIENDRKMPSGFVMKLRKHLENKLILNIQQINQDRIVNLFIGYTDVQYHLIIEFFSSGNIIFTDENYKILALHRNHLYEKDEEKVNVKVGEVYDIEKLKKILQTTQENSTQISFNPKGYIIYDNGKLDAFTPMITEKYENKKYLEYQTFSECIENYFKLLSEKPDNEDKKTKNQKKKKEIDKEAQKRLNIKNQIIKMEKKIDEVQLKINILEENKDMFDMLLKNINSYDSSTDIRTQVDYIKYINDGIKNLGCEYEIDIIYENTNRAEIKNKKMQIKHLVSGYIYKCEPNKYTYDIISDLYTEIKKIKGKIETTENLLNKEEKKIKYQLNLPKLNPSQDLKNHLPVVAIENSDVKLNIIITGKNKELWFEQFNWFVSSEGYLVISGKTADQNEALVKKYMDKNDLYMHSDAFGSGSTIIKRNNDIIPHITLEEASCFLISHTKCWTQNSPDRTFWVYSNQVSKTPETGEYLTKGSFIIRGERNYLSPPKLELGLTIVYKEQECEIPKNNITDKTLFALPMLAPYRTVNKNKLKVKIIPGTGKINKTIKNSIMTSFKKNMNSKEELYIKAITMEDYQKVMVNNIKIL